MYYGNLLTNPLLRTAVSVGESTIRLACERCRDLSIHIDMDEAPDGRDAVKVTLRSPDALTRFRMPFRAYFNAAALRRAAQTAWQRRIPRDDEFAQQAAPPPHPARRPSLN